MTLSQSPLMYIDARSLLEKALDSPKGIRVLCDTRGQAIDLSRRLNKARQMDRQQSMKIYNPGDPQYNRSEFDRLIVRVPKAEPGLAVLIEPRSVDNYKVENIT